MGCPQHVWVSRDQVPPLPIQLSAKAPDKVGVMAQVLGPLLFLHGKTHLEIVAPGFTLAQP